MTRDNEALKNLIASNRRALQALDDNLALMNAKLEPDDRDDQKRAPYFYGAQGADEENGILLGPAPNREFIGRIVTDPDAAFVWTHVLAVQRTTSPADAVGDRGFMGIWEGAGGANAKNPPNVDLGFVDEGTGRVLYTSERQTPGNTEEDGQLISGALFGIADMFNPRRGGFTAGVINEWAGGNGPNFAKQLPVEVLIPARSVISVRAKPLAIDTAGASSASRVPRVYVTLLGYKVEA